MAEGYTGLKSLWDRKNCKKICYLELFFLKDQVSLSSSFPTGNFHELRKGLMHNINHFATNSVWLRRKQSHQYFLFVRQKTTRNQMTH